MTKGKLLKALMLNAFVFPGMGQLSVGRKARGIVLILLVVIILGFLMSHVVFIVMAQARTYQPMAAGDLSQILKMSESINQDMMNAQGALLKSYVTLLMICYFGGLLDLVGIYIFERPHNS